MDGKIIGIEADDQVWNILEEKSFKIEVSLDTYKKIDKTLLSENVLEETNITDKNDTISLITSSAETKDQIIKNYEILSLQPITVSLNEIY